MKSTIITVLFIFFLFVPAHGQSVTRSHDLTSPAAAVRIRALQSQVEKQQIEIDALRNRLGNLQEKFQELAEIIADQNKASDDDDSDDDTDVTSLRVNKPAQKAGRHKMNAAKPVIRYGEARRVQVENLVPASKQKQIRLRACPAREGFAETSLDGMSPLWIGISLRPNFGSETVAGQ